ncbi:MAG: pilus assembly protein PilP [Candidatus Binatia bacterium]
MTARRLVWVAVLLAAASVAYGAPDSPVQPVEAGRDSQPYNPAGRRDPFRPFTLDIHPRARARLTPLQRYELGQLTVVATVWEVRPPRAMLEDSAGMGYIVTLGTPIGPNGGVVTAIEPERIVVQERVLDFYGKEQVNRIVLETPKEEGSNQPVRERQ